MTSSSYPEGTPVVYAIRVDGHLDAHWAAWWGDLALTHEKDGTTTLTGPVCDQAELHGLLMKVRDLGVTLVSVTLVGREAIQLQTHGT